MPSSPQRRRERRDFAEIGGEEGERESLFLAFLFSLSPSLRSLGVLCASAVNLPFTRRQLISPLLNDQSSHCSIWNSIVESQTKSLHNHIRCSSPRSAARIFTAFRRPIPITICAAFTYCPRTK